MTTPVKWWRVKNQLLQGEKGGEGEIDWHMTTPVKWWRVKNQLLQDQKRGETDWHKDILSSRVFHLFDKGWMDKQSHTGNYYIIHMFKVEGLNISSL